MQQVNVLNQGVLNQRVRIGYVEFYRQQAALAIAPGKFSWVVRSLICRALFVTDCLAAGL